MTLTSSGWCDTVIQDELLQVLCSVLKGGDTAKGTCRILLRDQIVNELDLCKSDGCAMYEFLSGMTRCSGYKPVKN